MTGSAVSYRVVLECGVSQPLPRTPWLYHDLKQACPDNLCASTSTLFEPSGDAAFLVALASVGSSLSTLCGSALRGVFRAPTRLEQALWYDEGPFKVMLPEDSAWIGGWGNVLSFTECPAFEHAMNSMPAGDE